MQVIQAHVTGVNWFGAYAECNLPGLPRRLTVVFPREAGMPTPAERARLTDENTKWLGKTVDVYTDEIRTDSGTQIGEARGTLVEVPF